MQGITLQQYFLSFQHKTDSLAADGSVFANPLGVPPFIDLAACDETGGMYGHRKSRLFDSEKTAIQSGDM